MTAAALLQPAGTSMNCTAWTDPANLSACLAEHGDLLRFTSLQEKRLLLAVHVVFCLLILATNGLAVLLYVVDRRLHTSYNMHILSVLTIDLCAGLFAIPANMLIHTPGVQGGAMCKAFSFFLSLIEAADVYSMVLIAVEKFLLLVLRPNMHRTLSQTASHVALVWLASVLYALKDVFAYESYVETHWDANVQRIVYHTECRIPTMFTTLNEAYVLLDLLLLFVIPQVVIVVCYISISINLNQHANLTAHTAQNRRAVRLHVTVVVCFFFSAVGLHTLRVYLTFGPGAGAFPEDSLVTDILTTVAFSDFWINPLLYCYFNTNFRSSWGKLRGRLSALRSGSLAVVRPSQNGATQSTSVGTDRVSPSVVGGSKNRQVAYVKSDGEDVMVKPVFTVA